MPLLGLVDGARTVSSLLTADEWAALKSEVRRKRCRVELPCGAVGHVKTSRLGTQYFAHNAGGDGCSAGERAEHLLAKSIIIAAARGVGWDAEPEHRGEGWIADVLATRGKQRIVFEVQWSPQSPDEFLTRQQRYKAEGIRCAWFARKTTGLSFPDPELPVFGLAVTDGQAHTTIEGTVMPLADAVTRLLTGRIRFRDHLANGEPSETDLALHLTDCYNCHKEFVVWNVLESRVTGGCGRTLPIPDDEREMWAQTRPEADPAIVETARAAAQEHGWVPARLGLRSTQTSGTRYMAFICPYCGRTSGDYFLQQQFRFDDPDATATGKGPRTAVTHPHWCLAQDDPLCRIPPQEVIDSLPQPDGLASDPDFTVSVTPVTRQNQRQVVADLFRPYYYPGR
ncbi:hypothetical protein RE9431_49570 (plasmid) [Prescottella equi]|uniref:competence protein CoiA n=1 Tax=Rhodococcus hoagii TaxID=43767 RepID=UPI001C78A163|nr:competence protein CoiA [Prescottella equi]BCN66502.1 hypothetical protein RE9431_49570 [Prescottella equi]